ncbi:PqqD family peptide modification chaperone [uncultured Mediterranea sp.]|uniref:PqqD family protein n=1 Tax=uncultured Mediterranea sp. TaxID=1926662 RepID=UPI0027D9B299|nr:PqqD family peptide modification chaperone [uncultured Mediterranea sp.]
MKIKDAYKLRQIAGEHLIVKQGKTHDDMTQVISLNDTAVLLWNELKGKDFTLEQASSILTDRFGITQEQAEADTRKWMEALSGCGIID